MITKHFTANKIKSYLEHKLTLPQLVDWAENVIMEEDIDEKDNKVLKEIISKIGLSDVNGFGITWEEFEYFLRELGYRAKVEVVPITNDKIN